MTRPDTGYWTLVAPAFVCQECGTVFETPVEWVEDYGQRFAGSPCCHADFDEWGGEEE